MTVPTFTPPNVLMMNAKTGTIPKESGTVILNEVMTGSAMMQLAKYEEMTKPVKEFNYLAGGIGAYWVDEAERIQTSKPTWLTAKMEAKKLGVIIPVSNEFLKYTAADFFEAVKPLIAEAFYTKFDQATIWGNSSPYATGQSVWADIVASGNTLELGSLAPDGNLYDELNELLGMVEDGDGDPNGWLTTKRSRKLFRGVKDSQGRPIFTDANSGTPAQLLGEAVAYVDSKSWDSTKATIMTGDWNYTRYGILEGIDYKISEEATISTIVDQNGEPVNLFERDMSALRATMSVGFMRLKDNMFAAGVPAPVGP